MTASGPAAAKHDLATTGSDNLPYTSTSREPTSAENDWDDLQADFGDSFGATTLKAPKKRPRQKPAVKGLSAIRAMRARYGNSALYVFAWCLVVLLAPWQAALLGPVLFLWGWLWIIVKAFEDEFLYGFFSLGSCGLYAFVYATLRWQKLKTPVLLMVGGIAMTIIGTMIAVMYAHIL